MPMELCQGCFGSTGNKFNFDTRKGVCGECKKKVGFILDSLLGSGYFPARHYIKKRSLRCDC